MHRINPEWRDTKPRHEELQDRLFDMLRDLDVTVKAGEQIGVVLRENIISTISQARAELRSCPIMAHTRLQPGNHVDLVEWLGDLGTDLKWQAAGNAESLIAPITVERIAEGRQMVVELKNCRRRVVFY